MPISYRVTEPGQPHTYHKSIAWFDNLPDGTEVWEINTRGSSTIDVRQIPVICGVPIVRPGADLEKLRRECEERRRAEAERRAREARGGWRQKLRRFVAKFD